MSIYLGEIPLANNNVSRNIGEIVASTLPITDAGLHLLDGSLISGNGAYSKFVTYIASLVSGYPDLFDTEANWQSSVTTYGVCGKFVYDSVNNTVRLPKITGFTEGTIDPTTLGDLTQAGLPNITGYIKTKPSNWDGTGCFVQRDSTQYEYSGTNQYTSTGCALSFNASLSNSIYGNSSTVQPQAIKVLYYIVIASSITNELNLDVADLERSKADVDLSNVNASGTSLASGWSMPSSRYIDLTLGASGSTYTAPANGWFCLGKTSGGIDKYVTLKNTNNKLFTNLCSGGGTGFGLNIYLPVKKGDVITAEYDATGTTNRFVFIYAKGEN